MRTRHGLTVLLGGLLILAVAAPAVAAWNVTSSTADGSALATAVGTPSAPVATPTVSSIALSWTAPSTGAPPTGYTVRRTAPSSAYVCVGVATASCTDTGLSPSTTYTYAITALVGPWSGSPLTTTATTSAASPSAFLVTVPATATAGTQFSITIQARNSLGANDTTYTGSHALTFSGPGTVGANAPAYPATASFNSSGLASNVKITLFKAETVTLTVADPVASQRTGVSSAIVVAPGAATQLRWTTDAAGVIDACPSGTVVVGANGQRSWYVGERDTYGNQTVEGAAARTITLSRTPNGGNAGSFTPLTLSIAANANPAVTGGTATLKLKKKNPAATTFTANGGGSLSGSCVLSP